LHEPFCPAYLIGECINQRERERREHSSCLVSRGSAKEERETTKWCAIGTLYTFTKYNKDKVHMDVVSFLVVNHVHAGVLYLFELCLCLYVWLSNRSRKYLNHLKGLDYS
jgi:hypothetical protein